MKLSSRRKSYCFRLIYPSRKPGASPCKSLLLAAGAGVPKPPKNRVLKAREAQNGGFGTGQDRGRARAAAGQQHGQQHGQQQRQEFQNHQKGAGSSKWWFWNWSGEGQGKGSSRAAARGGRPKNRFLKAREAQNGGFGAGAGFTLRAMISSAIKKCTPDSREGSIFLKRKVCQESSQTLEHQRSFLNIKFAVGFFFHGVPKLGRRG